MIESNPIGVVQRHSTLQALLKQLRMIEVVRVGCDPLPKRVWFVNVSCDGIYTASGIKQLCGNVTTDVSKCTCYNIFARGNHLPPRSSSIYVYGTLKSQYINSTVRILYYKDDYTLKLCKFFYLE